MLPVVVPLVRGHQRLVGGDRGGRLCLVLGHRGQRGLRVRGHRLQALVVRVLVERVAGGEVTWTTLAG